MGGVPVLFLLAAMGITYGWQPDGNGGVEYVIQIPPEQLEDLKRSGALTSVINPKVQGHVSRVIVKVGNETLREITPSELNQTVRTSSASGVRTASHDDSPVPIPEMREAVMKPADGFAFPPTLDDATSRAAGGLRAGTNSVAAELERQARETAAASAEQARAAANDSVVRAGNALRNAAATAFQGGTNNAGQAPTYPNQNNAIQPPDFTARTQPVHWPVRGKASQVPNRLVSEIEIGSPMVGHECRRPIRLRVGRTTRELWWGHPICVLALRMLRQPLRRPVSQIRRTTRVALERPAILRDHRPICAGTPDPRYPSAGYDPRAATEPSYGTSFASQNRNTPPTLNSRANVDQRLSEAQIATLPPGAWSIDAYGRPIDREGQVLDQWGRLVETRVAVANSSPNTRLNPLAGYGESRPASTTDPVTQPYPNSSYPASGYAGQYDSGRSPNFQTTSPSPDPRTMYATTNGNYSPSAVTPQPTTTTLQPPVSRIEQTPQNVPVVDRSAGFVNERAWSNQTGNDAGVTPGNLTSNRNESNGPLFNTLLLVSAVGNLYLFFWLKNLRYRFRDLVAAKRVVTSSSSTV